MNFNSYVPRISRKLHGVFPGKAASRQFPGNPTGIFPGNGKFRPSRAAILAVPGLLAGVGGILFPFRLPGGFGRYEARWVFRMVGEIK